MCAKLEKSRHLFSFLMAQQYKQKIDYFRFFDPDLKNDSVDATNNEKCLIPF
jgi:hypothetical protein